MSIKRKKVAKHILIPDTNILWCENKALSVSEEFSDFLEKNAGKYDIDLVIPDVVLGELQFQQTTSALKSLRKANAEFQKMSDIAGSKYSHRVEEKRIRRDVEKKLFSWVQQSGCSIVEVPVESIDWKGLIDDAVWRRPPFIEDKNTEKGFRDAVIVQTVASIVNDNKDVDVAFISADGLARIGAESLVGSRCTCYETLEEFESFLRLTDEKLTNEFVRAVQAKARVKFHSEKDRSCLIYKENLIGNIREEFSNKLEVPAPPSDDLMVGGLSGLLSSKNRWIPETRETVWIRAPQFVSLENENEFRWRSKIIFVQLYSYEGATLGSLLAAGKVVHGDKKLRKVEFSVIWKSKVSKNGRFIFMEFENFEAPETIFEPITDSDREKYGIAEHESSVSS